MNYGLRSSFSQQLNELPARRLTAQVRLLEPRQAGTVGGTGGHAHHTKTRDQRAARTTAPGPGPLARTSPGWNCRVDVCPRPPRENRKATAVTGRPDSDRKRTRLNSSHL